MIPFQHLFSAFAVGSLQNGILMILIDQKYTNVIKTKTLADELHGRRKKFTQVLHLCYRFRELSHCLQLRRATLGLRIYIFELSCTFIHTLFEICCKIFQFAVHLIELVYTFSFDEPTKYCGSN